jgi:apolipoprotein N-acyltransferase
LLKGQPMKGQPGRAWGSALATGAILGASTLPGPLGPLAFVGMVPLLRVLAAGLSPRAAAGAGFASGLVFFGVCFGWLPSASVGGGMPLALAYLAGVLLLAAAFGGFAFAVARVARASPALALVAAPGFWVGLEFARSQEWLFSVPWAHLGYGLGDWPLLCQGAGVAGVYGLSFWIVAANAGWVLMPRLHPLPRAALAAALLVPVGFGAAALREDEAPDGPVLRVAAVQPAIPEAERHRPERLQHNLRRLLELSESALAEPVDLLAWPESAYERRVDARGDAFLGTIAHQLGTPVVTGAWRGPDRGASAWSNAALLAQAGRTDWVAEKVHPLPVYERAPQGPLARLLARNDLWRGRFAQGAAPEPVLLRSALAGGGIAIGVLVCIDASYPDLARHLRASGARLLVTIANEAGTGAWSAQLHARAARLRAIENGVPVVRVANTGPSLWIDRRGRVREALSPGRAGAAAATLAVAGAPPLYVALGDGPVVAFLASTAVAAGALAEARSRRRAARAALVPYTPELQGAPTC